MNVCCLCESMCVGELVCACMNNNKALRGQEYEIFIPPL